MLIYVVSGRMLDKYRIEPVITSLFREGDKGVHGDWRGADFRSHDLTNKQATELVEWINSIFIYDPARPELKTALLHGEGTNEHIHVQVLWGNNTLVPSALEEDL